MAFLTSPSDYSGLYSPQDFGVSTQEELDDVILSAIGRAYRWIRRFVPKSTYDDAVASFDAGTVSDDQDNMRWAEYWMTRYELEKAKVDHGVVEERSGSLQVRYDRQHATKVLNRFAASAVQHLVQAGYDATGGGFSAGVRGGDPLPPGEPWFNG